jgi:signal peptidase I
MVEWRRVALYAAVLILVLLFSGKLIGLPVALVIVYGSSMWPTLKTFDLLVALSPRLTGERVKVGDIVIYCMPGTWNTACTVHRVISIRDGVVVTKGDAVEYPDPPVRLSDVKYVVVARVPRLFVVALAVLGLLAAFYNYVWMPRQIHGLNVLAEPGVAAFAMVIGFIVFDFVYLGTVYTDNTRVLISLPLVRKENIAFNISSGVVKVWVSYDKPLHPLSKPMCWVNRPFRVPLQLIGWRVEENYTIVRLRVDGEIFWRLWIHDSQVWANTSLGPGRPYRVATTLWVSCKVPFNLGVLRETYPITFEWREPRVVVGGGRVCIENENPVSMSFKVSMSGWTAKMVKEVRVPPFREACLSIPSMFRWVYVCYTFLGHTLCQGGVAR